MKALFIELPAFERNRARYLDDDAFRALQVELLRNPCIGDVIEGTGGLRKCRFRDERRAKGKRGGLRVIYYYWATGPAFWLFTLYAKGDAVDLTPTERAALKRLLTDEIRARANDETQTKTVH
jgi:hypothetical protein